MVYHLALHRNVQERIVEEIKDCIGSDEKVCYENINKLEYLEACIMETLRLCPPNVEHDRVCVNDCIVQGLRIKKGFKIQMPIYAAHHSEEFFSEPEKYRPERFLKENADKLIPYTWRPFGSGNRVCIAQRYATMQLKIFMAKLLRRFHVEAHSQTKLDHKPGGFFFLTYPEINVKLVERK